MPTGSCSWRPSRSRPSSCERRCPTSGRTTSWRCWSSPALASSARSYAVGGATEAVHHAEEVARTTVAALRAAGIHTSGHIGPTDPAVAVSDGLRTYAAEQVVVARHRQPPMRHLEDVPLDAAAEAFGVPLRELALDPVT